MNWHPFKVRPSTGILATYIVTDRTGAVRDFGFVTPNNMTLSGGVLGQPFPNLDWIRGYGITVILITDVRLMLNYH
jgi:hypothetical protein